MSAFACALATFTAGCYLLVLLVFLGIIGRDD
jgi:hypothetical protein